jgi:hypothetical protein
MSRMTGYYGSLIRQGDSLVWLVRPNTLAEGDPISSSWKCYAGVYRESDGAEVVAPWEVTDKTTHEGKEYFVLVLSPAVTAGLEPDTYSAVVDVSNLSVSPPYTKETPIKVQVTRQQIPQQV